MMIYQVYFNNVKEKLTYHSLLLAKFSVLRSTCMAPVTLMAPWCGSWSTCPVCGQEVAWCALAATYGRYGSKAALTQIPTGLGSPNVHQDILDVWRVAHLLIVA